MPREIKLGIGLAFIAVAAIVAVVKFSGPAKDKVLIQGPSSPEDSNALTHGPARGLADRSTSERSTGSPSLEKPRPSGDNPAPANPASPGGSRQALSGDKTADADSPVSDPPRIEVTLAGRDTPPPSEAVLKGNAEAPTLKELRASETSASAPGSASPAENASSPASHAPAVDYYQVQPGDTLAKIARMYYGSEQHAGYLQQANPDIADPAALRTGIRLRIPELPASASTSIGRLASGGTGSGAQTPREPDGSARRSAPGAKPEILPAGANPAGAARSAAPTSASRTYVVKAGDSFYGIAKRELGSATRWKELLALNSDLVDGEPKNLQAGHVIKLPG